MKTCRLIMVWLTLAGVGLCGCRSAPVRNLENVPVRINKSNYTLADVEHAILHAGACRGWHMYKEKPGVIQAIYDRRDYSAEATIAYSTREYSIRYRNSSNLDYEDGEIHENYNKWIQQLDDTIRRELLIGW